MLKGNDFINVKVGDHLFDYWTGSEVIVDDVSMFDFTIDYGPCRVIYHFDEVEVDLVFNEFDCWNKGGEDKCLKI